MMKNSKLYAIINIAAGAFVTIATMPLFMKMKFAISVPSKSRMTMNVSANVMVPAIDGSFQLHL
jgi:hypothetical protein